MRKRRRMAQGSGSSPGFGSAPPPFLGTHATRSTGRLLPLNQSWKWKTSGSPSHSGAISELRLGHPKS